MAPLRVLFAGDSNLKFVDQYVEKREKGHLVVLSVRGASVVGDSKGFRGRLQQHLIKFQPQVVFLHLGSNDAGSGKIYNFKSELLDLLNEIEYISPGVKVNLCLVLPRTYNHFKGILWNRRVLPRIQTDIEKVNQVVKQICLEKNLEFVNYGLPVSHLGSDGLHVKPLGAKHLLSTIIGKVKNKCFAPKVKEPCSPQPSGTVERTLDAEEWPVLPKTKMDEVWEAAFNTHCRVRQVDVLRKVTTIIKGTCNKKAILGTNPLCVAAPANDGDCFVLDMATTSVAFGKVTRTKRKDNKIPEGWGVDSNGMPTTNPNEVKGLHPLGGAEISSGYKGYGLCMMVEIFCGILSGANFGPKIRHWKEAHVEANLSQCFVAIDPNAFEDGFTDRMSDLMSFCRNLEPADGETEVLVAGDPERKHMALCEQLGGIPYQKSQLEFANMLAAKLNVEPMKTITVKSADNSSPKVSQL